MALFSPVRKIDVLGLLTIAAYGSWFYGFGVLAGDISRDLGVGLGSLGVVFGLTTLAGGCGAIGVGRLLDRRGPDVILRVIGPFGALLYIALPFVQSALLFCSLHVVCGGLISASAFYSFTQPIAMRIRPDEPMRAVTRLTIWGALASPIAIPLTEAARRTLTWRGAMRVSGIVLVCAFVMSAWALRGHIRTPRRSQAGLRDVIRSITTSAFLRSYAASGFFASMSVAALLVFQVPVMKWAGLSATAAASFAGARGLLQLIGRLPLLFFVTRFGAWRVQQMCKFAVILGAVALWLAGSTIFASVYVVIVGASAGALSALDGMVGHEVLPAENFATTIALLGFVATLGSALGPILAGCVVQLLSLSAVPIFVAATAIGAVACQSVAYRLKPVAP